MTGALVVFLLTYAVIAGRRLGVFRVSRAAAATAGAAVCVLSGILTPAGAYSSIDGDTLVLLLGMMILAAHLDRAGFFDWGAALALRLTRSAEGLLTLVVFSVGFFSALLVNDAVCLLLTPVLVRVVRRLQLGGTLFLMATATSANIGSVMTIVGNPQTILVGSLADLPFRDYFMVMAPLGIVCLGVNRLLLPRFFPLRRAVSDTWQRQAEWLDAPFDDADELPSGLRHTLTVELRPSLLVKCLASIAAALVAFFVGINPAWSALGAAALLLLLAGWEPRAAIKRVDLQLLLYVAGLFIIVGALRQHGASQAIFDVLQAWIGDTPVRQGWTLTLLTAIGSNVVGDIPFVLVASDWMSEWVQPRTAWLILAMASTFAGNLMLTSSMATLLVRDAGRDVGRLGFVEHLRYGAVITVATLVIGTLWLLAVT
ncbi:MAG: hypothetical protein JSW67_04560 [Candidatus Latescibacterota bacterium]|nr:MAG: hypothetical protein JSW67_04560 [Candidatus Latescibacterota bacterium]